MTISFVKQNNKINFKSITGDFFYNGSPTWEPEKYPKLTSFTDCLIKASEKKISSILSTHTPIHVMNISKKIELQFEKLNLDESILKMFRYKCQYNNFNQSSIVPTYYFCKDSNISSRFFSAINGETLLKSFTKEMYLDKSWVLEELYEDNLNNQLSELQNTLMGQGYSSGFYTSDGCSSTEPFLVELSNGDYIIFTMLLWCNQ